MLFNPDWKPTEVKLEPWQELLLKAADIIEQKGWTQGNYFFAGRYCMLGAIAEAAAETPEIFEKPLTCRSQAIPASLSLAHYLAKHNLGHGSIPTFNDAKSTTKRMVLKAMRDTVMEEL